MVATASLMVSLGTPCPDFSLPDTVSGATITRHRHAGSPLLIAVLSNHCPYVRFLREALARVTATYMQQGVAVVGVSSNDVAMYPDDAPALMRSEALAAGYRFPYCFDADQSFATALKAVCTPDFFLFDQQHRLAYRGQFCSARRKIEPLSIPTGSDLTAAVTAVLTHQPAPEPQRASIGCNIKWKPGNGPESWS